MDDKGQWNVPLKIDVSAAIEDLKQLDGQLKAIQQDAERAERELVKTFNKTEAVRRGVATPASSIGEVRGQISTLSGAPLTRTLRELHPTMQRVAQANAAVTTRVTQLERQARSGNLTPAPSPTQAAQARLTQTTAALGAARQQTQQRYMAAATLPYRLAATQKILVEGTPSFIDRLAKANMRAQPAMDLYRAAGGRGPAAASGVSRLFGGALEMAGENPVAAAAILGLGATVGGGLAINEAQVNFRRQQAALSSAMVGGPTLGNARTVQGLQIADIGRDLNVGGDSAAQLAQTVAAAGTSQADLINNLKNTVMLSGPNQLPSGDIANLTGALGTSGGMNNSQINRTYQAVPLMAHDAHVSIQELVASMKSLSSTAIGAAKDTGGLAAIQSLVGASSGINAGQLLSPALSAEGANAYKTAGLLGMSPQQLLSAQTSKGGTAQIYDRIAALVRRVGKGPNGVTNAETVLDQTGLITPPSSPGQYAKLIEGMLKGTPGQASQKAAQLYNQADKQAVSQDKSYRDAAAATRDNTTAVNLLRYGLQDFATHLLNGTTRPPGTTYGPPDPATRIPGTTSGLVGTTYGTGMHYALHQGVSVKNIKGFAAYAGPDVVQADYAAARRNNVSPATLLAMQAQESGFNSSAVSNDGGYGLAQFTDPTVARKYLHVKPGQDWHAAALNPRRAAEGQAEYLADLIKQAHGNEQAALAMYNGGVHPGKAALAYGAGVEKRAKQTADRLDVHVDVTVHDQNGQRLPHTVNHTRTVVGGRTHGPAPTPGHGHR